MPIAPLAAARAALSQAAEYVTAMKNPYGITLDREWSEWAAKFGASPTVAAALFLISECHPSLEVIAKLTLGEVEEVAAIVQRWPDCFPPGSLDALKCRSQTLAQPPSVRVSADPTSRRRPARVSAESLHRRAYTRRFEHAQGAGMPTYAKNSGTRPGTRAETARRRLVVEDLWKAGLSVRAISAGTGIPVGSVHRAMRAIARAEAKKDAAIAEMAKALLGKRLSHRGGRRP